LPSHGKAAEPALQERQPPPSDAAPEFMSLTQFVIVHAHCYQPPREDPWLEAIEAEPSAAPDHDWNARIDRECYRRLGATELRARDRRAALRDPDARSGLARIVNLYAWCSFDAAPTLCDWLEAEAPETWRMMLEGDAASVKRLGHGNAIAAPYHHVILPLASRRDKVTEVRWGLADFRRRFGRDAEGMWLPECAVDEETLEVLADEGVRFTILAPYQVEGATGDGMPVRWTGRDRRSLSILPYDGHLAGEVAFGGLLQNAAALESRLAAVHSDDPSPRCTTLATDGETFGHHHRNGEVTLAAALTAVERHGVSLVTNAAALIAAVPPTLAVRLVSPSSWSCAHGVERWRSDCGCRLDSNAHTSQRWRRPLREAMNWLADYCHAVFEREGRALFIDDPWSVRDAYGTVVALDDVVLAEFVRSHVRSSPRDESDSGAVTRGRTLLELERAVMRTFTSCAWFFDDVARIETRQVLRYAARAMELSGHASRMEGDLLATLGLAVSNVRDAGTAADLFVREALPHAPPPARAAAAAAALRRAGLHSARVASYNVYYELGRDWDAMVVNVEHRRTGARHRYTTQFAGDGIDLQITVIELLEPFSAPVTFGISDLPEAEARTLLLPLSTTA
jgi:alpha-amylase/alpha-mannosidase (GH57 family)